MQMALTVEPQGAYNAWMAEQLKKPFEGAPPATADSAQAKPAPQTAAVMPVNP
jgi:heme/copper-type cytochrome/quinol oxidase subunit 2